MVTGLPKSNGYNTILVIIDHFSKAIILVTCNTELSSEGWAKILCDEIYAKYGMPIIVISDQGPQFISKFLKDLQTDKQNTNWADWLPLTAFQHNNCVHSTMGKSPFFVNYRRNPRVTSDSHSYAPLQTPASNSFKATMKLIHDETKAALQKSAEQMKMQYDKKKKAAVEYQIRDKVWLNTTNLHLAHPKKKLNDKHIGPFPILKKHSLSAYKLKLPLTWKIYSVFNETLLHPFTPPAFLNQEQPPPPPPDIVNSEEQYEVEAILDNKTHKVHRRADEPLQMVTDYLVKWKGYGLEENK
ncbi:uncharacterized protein ARMOST_04642 [Armillaria ostoyae]|uniref:Integrase catalytic domain-containing protein n=1 Tax=Armillaria ostoyae TaxID=47428 RepID=A0A284QY56_ARMOS|nr:uncharacterized protein ARMOST_04642 [Armillaria ostoyae]